MGDHNLENLDDEELLSLYDETEKLLRSNAEHEDPPAQKKAEVLKRKLSSLEQEMKLRSLWESEQG
ncbi:MAG: hypothetical protein NPINA01_11590 [Nitrospinaceae bacterium]|nr:MAG: hypothetical protein NPINA01_11590 [Nitrospinaceae bacterium]